MAVKIENHSSLELPKGWEDIINEAFDYVPREDVRGVDRVVLVDFIKVNDARIKEAKPKGDTPALFHPREQHKSPWFEISAAALLMPTENWSKKMLAKKTFRFNLTRLVFLLAGYNSQLLPAQLARQRQPPKPEQIQARAAQYGEKKFAEWQKENVKPNWQTKLFGPLRPFVERWAKSLNEKALNAQKRGK